MAHAEHRNGFTDHASGLCLVMAHPAEAPRLWRAYLDGATARYRQHGVERALERDRIADGRTVSLFWVALEGDDVVAGLRCHGPLASAEEAHALVELGDHPDLASIRADLAGAVRHGLLELKGGWVQWQHPASRALGQAVGRCHLHAMEHFAARFAICTASTHALTRWRTAGAVAADYPPVAYPDERFDTCLLWWDRHRVSTHAEPQQIRLFAAESAELAAAASTRCSPAARRAGERTANHPQEWRPLVLREDDLTDGEVVTALRADPAVTEIDRLAQQRHELAELQPACPAELLTEAPRCVYYPWRHSLVRLLGPNAFRRLRLDRNRYKLTADEQQRAAGWTVGVVGLSVGHAIAHTLALEGVCGRLRLADPDSVAISNLNRLPATVLDVDVNKAVVAARRLAELDPYLDVEVWAQGVDAANLDTFLADVDVAVEECDALDLKLRLREAARRHSVPVLMETSDRGLLDVERFDLEPERPAFHGLVAGLAADDLAGLSTRDKAPHVLRLLEPDQLSPRMAASMAEIDQTVSSWPQLAGDVMLGAASIAAALSRLARGQPLPSGRVRIDLDGQLDGVADPAKPQTVDHLTPVPRQAPPDDPPEIIAHAAHLAPSGGNSQPWCLELTDDELRVRVDRTRTSTLDQGFRGSYTAIGAALLNARAAASASAHLGPMTLAGDRTAGHGTEPERDTGPERDVVATLAFGEGIDLDLAELYPYVLARRTNRQPGQPAAIDRDTAATLHAAAAREGATLQLATDPGTIAACAELLAESDRLRYLTPWLHRELMSELRWPGRDGLHTGIDVRTLELDAADLAKLSVARRGDVMAQLSQWNVGRALGDGTRDRVRSSSGLAAVTIRDTDPAAFVRGGSAVERVWLEAERARLSVQPVSPVFIYAVDDNDYVRLVGQERAASLRSLSQQLHARLGLCDGEHLVLLLRLSHAPHPSLPSGRRPLGEVLARADPAAPARGRRPARTRSRP